MVVGGAVAVPWSIYAGGASDNQASNRLHLTHGPIVPVPLLSGPKKARYGESRREHGQRIVLIQAEQAGVDDYTHILFREAMSEIVTATE